MKLKLTSLTFFFLTIFFGFIFPTYAFALESMNISNVYVRNDHVSFTVDNASLTPHEHWLTLKVKCIGVGIDPIVTNGLFTYDLINPYAPSSHYSSAYNNTPHADCFAQANDGFNNYNSIQHFSIPTALPTPTPTNTPPAIGGLINTSVLLANSVIGSDGRYVTNSSFVDPDSTSWTATINYGDDTGTLNLPLNLNKTFSLNHQYSTPGVYTITVAVTDDQQTTGIGNATVTAISPHTFDASNIEVTSNHISFNSSNFSIGGETAWNTIRVRCNGVDRIVTNGLLSPYDLNVFLIEDYSYNNAPYTNCGFYNNELHNSTNYVSNQTFNIPSAQTNALFLAINAGGDTQGNYAADTDFSGGTQYSSSNAVDTSGVSSPASEAVYKAVRYGNFTYTIPNLTANAQYTVRLHFNELYWGTSNSGNQGGIGSRVFNVSVNGTQALNNYDIYDAAGGADKAIVEQLSATADSNGHITLGFSTVVDNAMVNGIEIYSGTLPSPTPTPTPTPVTQVSINSGGAAASSYLADRDYSGGQPYSSSANVDTSGITNPAPESVYQSVRYGNITYTIPNLAPNTTYQVRLHFNELYWGTALSGNAGGTGSRLFNVSINATQVLTNYDIYQSAGGANKAKVEEFTATANANGRITIVFTTVVDNAMVNGIELFQ